MSITSILATVALTGGGGLLSGAALRAQARDPLCNCALGIAGGSLGIAGMHLGGLDVASGFGRSDLVGWMGQLSIGTIGATILLPLAHRLCPCRRRPAPSLAAPAPLAGRRPPR